jgi:ATP-binding cassette subfamily C (CFTR/MRP) protein 4
MLRTSFRQTTLLTIAHRLHTIMDYDVVLVMDDGRAVEFGSPKVLLQDDNGIFTNLVEATGVESASALRKIANSSS